MPNCWLTNCNKGDGHLTRADSVRCGIGGRGFIGGESASWRWTGGAACGAAISTVLVRLGVPSAMQTSSLAALKTSCLALLPPTNMKTSRAPAPLLHAAP